MLRRSLFIAAAAVFAVAAATPQSRAAPPVPTSVKNLAVPAAVDSVPSVTLGMRFSQVLVADAFEVSTASLAVRKTSPLELPETSPVLVASRPVTIAPNARPPNTGRDSTDASRTAAFTSMRMRL